MTLADFLPRRAVHRGRVVSNVEILDLPDEVRTNRSVADLAGTPVQAHRLGSGTHTACGESLALFGLDATVDIRMRGDAQWCRVCWPTERYCGNCKAPSGQDTRCVPCAAVASDADKRIEASQS